MNDLPKSSFSLHKPLWHDKQKRPLGHVYKKPRSTSLNIGAPHRVNQEFGNVGIYRKNLCFPICISNLLSKVLDSLTPSASIQTEFQQFSQILDSFRSLFNICTKNTFKIQDLCVCFSYKRTLPWDCHHDLRTQEIIWANQFSAMLSRENIELCTFNCKCNENHDFLLTPQILFYRKVDTIF